MNNVVVVRRGEKYSDKYPKIIRRQVEANTSIPIQFHVIGDGYDATIKLRHDWPRWWPKLELFAPWNMSIRPCLFLDLDTYILGNIDDIVSQLPDRLTMLRDFNKPERGQSAIMQIPRNTNVIWSTFSYDAVASMKRFPGGDQAFLGQFPMGFLQDRFDGIYSYKVDNLQAAPKGRIVCFHGKPKPHETEGWAREVWDG